MKKLAPLTRAIHAAAVAIFLGGLVIAGTGTASATTASPSLSCGSKGCGDPVATGCNVGAYVILAETFMGGAVNMWWSPSCGVNWVQYDVPNDNYSWDFHADITGSSGETADVFTVLPGWEWTDVVLSPGPAKMCITAYPYPSGAVAPRSQCWTQAS
ncbi:hypothetical protein GA0115240_117724 [Streptomyces sp. DvalAA-14]|uniref:hypothetical protein n=1 Tax=unclassified Streptomyces TaxID=2593676 RepID=UPI00081B7148|nr:MULTISPECIES: hypothetical protein [unclassified Streptomyces]MYS20227.1 hypothetical protein [Streptomyces sp. SID4948]SCD63943.1 hypothetical protein GA0115240_117724 [Streptomyces sp. DvalAA-14]